MPSSAPFGSAGVTVTWTGIKELETRLREASAEKATRALSVALYREALRIFAESQRITPVDTGALRGSGVVTEPRVTGTTVEVVIGYGGPAAPYAVYVHEIPPPPNTSTGGRSATHNPPTQWKYLEDPFNAAAEGISERLKLDVETVLLI